MNHSPAPRRLYQLPGSGHCHRIELMLALLGLDYETVDVDLQAGEQRRPEFLALNRLGQVPVLVDGELTLSDSNAILVYLAQRYAPDGGWLPQDPVAAAGLQRWFSLAASWLAYGPASARFQALVGRPIEERSLVQGRALFGFMEAELADGRDWLMAGARPSLADVSLYSYSSQAALGGLPLDPYPQVRAWLARVEALPGFIPFQDHL
ncbi:glutathione S-transferase family protein [Roseateles sp. DAIF2]|uniref:glutathione S-transferase family protein n=1 Tax=Roseateles sp. DAIF2 TaxID=2714952 RepID=UPI0018A32257|nr:glutathione S-transferase family protein [Roseateles sp. DAIF2]QPF75917.1 glutathione S-transferase family protein [Roseateles sp. DAIF2]